MKKIIRYNLPLNHKYTLIDIEHGTLEDGNVGQCDNCSRVITNIAIVKNELNEVFRIGLDCAETLSYCDNNDRWKIIETEAYIKRVSRYLRKMKEFIKEGKFSIVHFHNKENPKYDFITMYHKAGVKKWDPPLVYFRMSLATFNKWYRNSLKDIKIEHDYEQ
jgi:hypothetical protein